MALLRRDNGSGLDSKGETIRRRLLKHREKDRHGTRILPIILLVNFITDVARHCTQQLREGYLNEIGTVVLDSIRRGW